ncbi:MAG: hypothetical protein ACKOLA_01070, partial [Spartobacteria bacterium]
LEVHQILAVDAHRFSYLPENWRQTVADGAVVHPSVRLIGGCAVGEGAVLENSVVWPGEIVVPSAQLRRAVLAGGRVCEAA